jgi:branched-chain amino acid aminotransferase
VLELAAGLGLRVVESDLTLYDAYTADEAFWTTSSYCMLPCQRINHVRVRQAPGPVFAQLMEAWSKAVGVDIIDQARRYHTRPSNVWRGAGAATLPATQDPRT